MEHDLQWESNVGGVMGDFEMSHDLRLGSESSDKHTLFGFNELAISQL